MFAKTFLFALFMLLAVTTVHVAAVQYEGLRGLRQKPRERELHSPNDTDVSCHGYCKGDKDCLACCHSNPHTFYHIYDDCTKSEQGGGVDANKCCRDAASAATCPPSTVLATPGPL
ncbi:hypothetical protein ACA910_013838 [Epithemia clementina (nom. ined.)]